MKNQKGPALSELSESNGFTPIIILVVVALAVGVYFAYKNLLSKPPAVTEQTNLNLSTAESNFPVPSDWETYTNTKLGFYIRYPKTLKLKSVEANPKAEYREYNRKCESGEIDGCGGSRYPDFRTDFVDSNGITIFSVTVYQLPVKDYGLGDIEKDNFTYGVNIANLEETGNYSSSDKSLIEKIPSTLAFIGPDKPLSCLWSTELGPGFDPIKDNVYIEENKNSLSLLSGYLYDESVKSCNKTSFYTWTDQKDTDAPPFKTQDECQSTCVN